MQVDVLVVGAGPAGSSAARAVARAGLHALIVEQRATVGLPVQCAEYVPARIVDHAPLTERSIARRIRTLSTHLPDGEIVTTPAAGYVLHRALFDQALAIAALKEGAGLWTGTRAVERTERGVLVRRGRQTVEVTCAAIIGADGPRSTVGRWIGHQNETLLDALQVEALVHIPGEASTHIYFDPVYRGGYGWLFPKGETANVGVGVNRALGGDPRAALDHLLEQLEIRTDAIVSRSAGLVPAGGTLDALRVGPVLLAGDAAGHTHPITGAGILTAVVSGELAGQAAARAIESGDPAALNDYTKEWASFMQPPLRHALQKRRFLDQKWSDDPVALSGLIRQTWIAFKEYGRRRTANERMSKSAER